MADYTDIDKLREQTRDAEPSTGPWTPFTYEDGPAPRTFVTDGQGRRHHVFSENAAQHLNQRDAAVAELVGLRTEVDQLRTDNERLSAENDQLHEACRLLGAVNVAESQDVYAGWSAKLAAAGAERDALQARIDAATKLHVVDSGQCWHCDYEWPCPTVAALGVDPQKEDGDA